MPAERRFGLWNPKRFCGRGGRGNVLVAHANVCIGESIALMLRLKGFGAVTRTEADAVELMLENWCPATLLFDTELGRGSNFRMIRDLASDPLFSSLLIIAITHVYDSRTPAEIRRVGFDGLCLSPCPVWMLIDMLREHSLAPPLPD